MLPRLQAIINYDDNCIYRELDEIDIICRLNDIKQLGIAEHCNDLIPSSQTRYLHSLMVAVKMDYLAQKFGLERKLALCAGMMHDIATTPLSDSISKPLNLNDQKYFEMVLESSPSALAFIERYDIPKKQLINIVSGKDKSPIGQLISSKSIDVDRWCYVIEDASKLNKLPYALGSVYYPDPFKSMVIKDNVVAFEDIIEVQRFLEARVCMFEQAYRQDKLSAKEAFLGEYAKELWREGILNKENIFRMTDSEFRSLVYGNSRDKFNLLFGINGADVYGRFFDEEEELMSFLKKETSSTFIVKKSYAANSGVKTPIWIDNKLVPYDELNSSHSRHMENRMNFWNCTTVYGLEHDRDLAAAVHKAKNRFNSKN